MKTSFLIDGFNLYHSIRSAGDDFGGNYRWLDLKSLCFSYLHMVGNGAVGDDVFYFSALASHLDRTHPDTTKRHRTYIDCLKFEGVICHLHKFQQLRWTCDICGQKNKRHEEKKTDVAITSMLFELLITQSCDNIVIVSGDTDILPAAETARRLYSSKNILFAFPYRRANKAIKNAFPRSFNISAQAYATHQFPDPYVKPNGKLIAKPTDWK